MCSQANQVYVADNYVKWIHIEIIPGYIYACNWQRQEYTTLLLLFIVVDAYYIDTLIVYNLYSLLKKVIVLGQWGGIT